MSADAVLKLLFASAIFAVIITAGWLPFKKRLKTGHHHDFVIGETLATGVFLGAALMHMLPEANTLFINRGYHYPYAFILTGAVFLFFLWFEHLGTVLYSQSKHTHTQDTAMVKNLSGNHPAFAILAWAMAIQLNKSTLSIKKAILFFISFALMTPAGIFIGWYFGTGVETNSLADPILIAASAGTFLYLGTLHGLEQCVMVERCCNLRDFSFVIIGFLLMACVAAYV